MMNKSLRYGLLYFLAGMAFVYAIGKYLECKKSPADRLIEMADGFLISRGLYAVAQYSIADQLLDGPQTAEYIANNLHLNAEAVFRLLRMLAAHGVFAYTDDSRFALNEIAELLTTRHPYSLHGFLLHEDVARWQAYGSLDYTLITGKPSFNHLFGEGYFDYIARDKKRSEQFDRGMANISEEENKHIAAAINFAQFSHIVDVGGGVGGLLAAIVHRYPTLHTTLYELPHLVPLAADYIKKQHIVDHVEIVAGTFLNSVVAGGNLYILKRILHDWDDATCITILKNCHAAMDQNARILIFDCIVPEGNSYDISKDIDVIMMTIFGGKERTKKDFERLLHMAGFKLQKVTPIKGTMLSGIEAAKL